jgi:AAA domain/Primase C terminal 2 (PriCT-2)/RepB DNA-primase N-terminal domain
VDVEMARRFLQLVDANDTFTSQTFHDRPKGAAEDRALARVIPGPAGRELLNLRDRGAGVYFTVNRTDGAGRKGQNITNIRAVWQEDDDGVAVNFPIEPSLVVESSPGRFHRYWLLAEPWPADERGRADHAAVMERMIETYGSDPNAKDLSRVLRVPGFLNRKHGDPHQVRIVSSSGWRYSRAEILAAFPPVEQIKAKTKAKTKTNGATPHSKPGRDDGEDQRIRDALFSVDATKRHVWLTIGMAIEAHYGQAGRALWDEWSLTAKDKHNPADQDRAWDSFKGSGISIGTLFHYAKHGGWEDSTKGLYEGWCRRQAPPKDDEQDGLREWDFGEDASLPPPREWLLGTTFCRTFLSSLLAAGGVGKTALRYAQFLSLATGRNLTGEHVHLRCRVLVISLEDDENELKRRMLALMKYHGISHDDVRGWLFVSAPGRSAGKLLEADPVTRRTVVGTLAANIEAAIARRKPDLVSLDPFVKSHSAEENNNTVIDEVAQILTDLGSKHNIGADAPHHVSKGAADPGNADKGRGASAMVDAARLVKTLTPMSAAEAKAFGIREEDRRQFIRVDNGKVNLARSGGVAQWFELIGVPLDNGTELYPNGDTIQVVRPWSPPQVWADLSNATLNQILDKIDAGLPDGERYTDGAAAKARAAWRIVVATTNKTEGQAKEMIKAWIKSGTLERREYRSETERKDVQGLWVNAANRPGNTW